MHMICCGPFCDKERAYVTERQRWKEDTHSGAPTHHSNGDVFVCKSHNCQETRKLKQQCTLCKARSCQGFCLCDLNIVPNCQYHSKYCLIDNSCMIDIRLPPQLAADTNRHD
ncbi:unnamed protein product [Trifolium pratense]|uniref:Uncharacterized protein n=1 Tax=Trifolium pratense TaxID=57577 RepID=A0ACB0L127_TRIPR|nr:unnamed protein product [Trifolium pratense]